MAHYLNAEYDFACLAAAETFETESSTQFAADKATPEATILSVQLGDLPMTNDVARKAATLLAEEAKRLGWSRTFALDVPVACEVGVRIGPMRFIRAWVPPAVSDSGELLPGGVTNRFDVLGAP